jgi:hypothetical protein
MEVLLDCPEIDMGLDAHQAKKIRSVQYVSIEYHGDCFWSQNFRQIVHL